MKTIKIDIWSDFVCPFCYIGRKKLEEALKEFDLWGKVEMNYKSLELDASKDRDKTTDAVQQFADKYEMPLSKAQHIMKKTQAIVEKEGLVYNYKDTVSASTYNAHRLNYYAKEFGKSEEITKRIMHANFVEGLDIGNIEILAILGEEIGLDRKEVLGMLSSDKYSQQIKDDRKMAEELKIDVVPTYIINGEHRISGVLETEDYRELLKKVTADN